MAKPSPVPRAVAALLASLAGPLLAQTAALPPVTITSPALPAPAVSGFDVPLHELPAAATVIDRRAIEAQGARRLADLTQFDPSVTDAYNCLLYTSPSPRD